MTIRATRPTGADLPAGYQFGDARFPYMTVTWGSATDAMKRRAMLVNSIFRPRPHDNSADFPPKHEGPWRPPSDAASEQLARRARAACRAYFDIALPGGS